MSLGIDLRDKYLYIIDIRFKQKDLDLSKYITNRDCKVLSLTPYSSYLLDIYNIKYITFHSIVSEEEFSTFVLNEYITLREIFEDYKEYLFLFRDLASIKTFEIYLEYLYKFIDDYKIVYITDSENKSLTLKNSDKIVYIKNRDNLFYKKNRFKSILNKKDLIKKIYGRYIKKDIGFNYDNRYFANLFNRVDISIKNEIDKSTINRIVKRIENRLVLSSKFLYTKNSYKSICNKVTSLLNKSNIKFHPFTFLSESRDYRDVLLYGKNSIPKIFMQHGSYIQENIFLKYNEIYPADINFVFNDYTKNLFEKRGAKDVYSVGSIDFNYKIEDKKKRYDFVYITYCTSYAYRGLQIFSEINTISIDGDNIYKRHKSIIELFGTKFKDKKICIKFQDGIVKGDMNYVPFLELSKKYENVTVEFFTPLSRLFQESKYIISDYISSEFINRDIHYKRDIILFKSNPIPIDKNLLNDMEKLFILIDTAKDLEDKINTIDTISRKKYNNIIEYYSSKKCDTQKVVTDIMQKKIKLG